MKNLKLKISIIIMLNVSTFSCTAPQSHIANIFADECNDLLLGDEPTLSFDEVYGMFIEKIKQHEGYRGQKYHTGIATDGWTIGYGHLIKKGEVFPNVISEVDATILLKKDFNAAIKLAQIHSPKLKQDKYKYQLLAISSFIFSKGVGNYSRSTLKNLVNNNKPIDTEIIKWSVVRKNTNKLNYYKNKYKVVKIKKLDGKYKHQVSYIHPKMVVNRKFELSIYNI